MKIVTHMMTDEIYDSVNDIGNKLILDTRQREEKTSLSPVESVLAALASCAAVDIVVMLKKRKKEIEKFTIETDGTRQESAPRYFTKIHCRYTVTSPNVTEEELQKSAALALEKYCSVGRSLKAEITFSVQVVRPL